MPPALDQPFVLYYAPVPEADETLALMTVINETFMERPWYGSRQMARHLRRWPRGGAPDGENGAGTISQRPRTSEPHPRHCVYPCLLRKLAIDRPSHVWCVSTSTEDSAKVSSPSRSVQIMP